MHPIPRYPQTPCGGVSELGGGVGMKQPDGWFHSSDTHSSAHACGRKRTCVRVCGHTCVCVCVIHYRCMNAADYALLCLLLSTLFIKPIKI